MAGEVKITYQDMRDNCTALNGYAGELEQITAEVMRITGSFTSCWEGQTEAAFEEDYNVLSNAITTTINTMREITTLAENYVNSMEEVEMAYGKSHVSVG